MDITEKCTWRNTDVHEKWDQIIYGATKIRPNELDR